MLDDQTLMTVAAASLIVCGICGVIVSHPRNASHIGFWLGLLLGPLGVLAAFRLDCRRKCYRCATRLDDDAEVCPGCQQHVGRVNQRWR